MRGVGGCFQSDYAPAAMQPELRYAGKFFK